MELTTVVAHWKRSQANCQNCWHFIYIPKNVSVIWLYHFVDGNFGMFVINNSETSVLWPQFAQLWSKEQDIDLDHVHKIFLTSWITSSPTSPYVCIIKYNTQDIGQIKIYIFMYYVWPSSRLTSNIPKQSTKEARKNIIRWLDLFNISSHVVWK